MSIWGFTYITQIIWTLSKLTCTSVCNFAYISKFRRITGVYEVLDNIWYKNMDDLYLWVFLLFVDARRYISFTLNNCYLSSEDILLGGTNVTESISNRLYNLVEGISNPNVFVVPPSCQQTKYHQTEPFTLWPWNRVKELQNIEIISLHVYLITSTRLRYQSNSPLKG